MVLKDRFRFAELDKLVVRKREGAEQMALDAHDVAQAQHEGPLNRLEAKLQEAHDASQISDEPTLVAALQDFVVQLCLGAAVTKGA